MYNTPFKGPRRLRSDSQGNLWIAAFPESMIVKFAPKTETFSNYPLPVKPLGSETPYSLNVDIKRDIVWINGNTSDALYSYHIDEKKWSHYPLPKRVSFTRDIEIAPVSCSRCKFCFKRVSPTEIQGEAKVELQIRNNITIFKE